jgi:alkylation response protein AidB-like acyl-CoA dehydrogenase
MDYVAPVKDMRFTLEHVAGLAELARLPGLENAEAETVTAVLEEAAKFSAGVLSPLNRGGDQHGAKVENGVVRTAPGFAAAYKKFVEGGWNGMPFPEELGGGSMPWAVTMAAQEMVQSANLSFSLCPLLTQGAIDAIIAHGTDEQRAMYLPKMVSGEWTGSMNLTEPQAGSDVGALKSKAVPVGDGRHEGDFAVHRAEGAGQQGRQPGQAQRSARGVAGAQARHPCQPDLRDELRRQW